MELSMEQSVEHWNRMEENISNKFTNRYKSDTKIGYKSDIRACHGVPRESEAQRQCRSGMAMSSLVPWAKGRPSETEETDLCSLFSDVIRRLTIQILKVEQDGTGTVASKHSGYLWIGIQKYPGGLLMHLMQNTRPDPRLQQASGSSERPQSCSLPLCKQVSDQLWPCPCLLSRVS